MKKFVCTIALVTGMICFPNEYIVGDTLHNPVTDEQPVVDEVTVEEKLPIIDEEKNAEIVPKTISLGVCKLTAYCMENYPPHLQQR